MPAYFGNRRGMRTTTVAAAPAVPDSDENFDNLALRLTFTDDSYDDTSPNAETGTVGGTPTIVGDAFRSSEAGAGGDYLVLPTNADYDLGGATKAWTIEFYLKTEAADATQFALFSHTNTAENTTNAGYGISGDGAGKLKVFVPGFGDFLNFLTTTADYNDGVWHHWALVHEADGDYRWYIDGAADTVWAAGTGTDWITSAKGDKVMLNRAGVGTPSVACDIDDFKIYNGVAKYTGAFTPAARSGEDTLATIFGSNLVAWYDASDAASITHVAGAVSQWNDKSGNDYHVTQGTAANKPTYSATGLGGSQPSLSFDGGDYLISGASAVAPGAVGDFAAFMVGRLDTLAASNSRFASFVANGQVNDHNNTGSMAFFMRNSNTEAVRGYRNGDPKSSSAVTFDTTFNGASLFDGVGDDHTMYVENVAGTPVADAAGNIGATGTLYLGTGLDSSAPNGLITGHLCEFAFVKIAPTAGQLSSVQTMLAAKWTA
jgi:hypothetical protein